MDRLIGSGFFCSFITYACKVSFIIFSLAFTLPLEDMCVVSLNFSIFLGSMIFCLSNLCIFKYTDFYASCSSHFFILYSLECVNLHLFTRSFICLSRSSNSVWISGVKRPFWWMSFRSFICYILTFLKNAPGSEWF